MCVALYVCIVCALHCMCALYCIVCVHCMCVLYCVCIVCVLYCMCALYVRCIVCVHCMCVALCMCVWYVRCIVCVHCMCVALCVCMVCALYCQCVMYCFACRDNLVFVMSDCPHSSEDLAAFFHLRAQLPSTQLKGRGSDTKGVFLSEGLSAQLKKCSLSLHWVDTSPLQGKTQVVVVAVLSQQKGIDVQ